MDADPPPRTAELVLCTREGSVLGSLPAIEVPTPWWQDIEPVVEAARDAFGSRSSCCGCSTRRCRGRTAGG